MISLDYIVETISNYNWTGIIEGISTFVTAIATFLLFRVTKLLARETEKLAEATSQPHIVAVIIPNQWSINHFDLCVENTGNATAYDIQISFEPPLKNGEAREYIRDTPYKHISVLKPGQKLFSHLSEFQLIKGKSYDVRITWKRNANVSERQCNNYNLHMNDYENISQLGENEAMVRLSKSIKKFEENWSRIARGHNRIKIDTFSNRDRINENKSHIRSVQRQQQKNSTL